MEDMFCACNNLEEPPTSTVMLESCQFCQVIFGNIEKFYVPGTDITCYYNLSRYFMPRKRDWVGIFRVGWKTTREYFTFMWAPEPRYSETGYAEPQQVVFKAYYLPKDDEYYQFCYVDQDGQINGASIPFQFRVEANDDMFVITKEGEVEKIQQQNATLLQENKNLKKKLASLQEQNMHLQEELVATKALQDKVNTLENKCEKLESQKKDLEKEKYTIKEELMQLCTSVNEKTTDMAAESQAVAMSSQELMNTLLLHQQEVEAEIRKLQAAILHLVQPLMVPIALVEQPVSSRSGLPEKFGGEADKMKNFIGQCELFMGIRAAEFPTDHAKVSFILSLLKESAAKWAQPIIEGNDPIMNNYQNFMERFRAYFGNLIQTVTASQTIQQFKQGNRRVQLYIADFKLLAAEADWNDSALIDQFKHGLHRDIQSELAKQGVPQNLDELFHSCLLIDAHLEELKWKQETSCRPKIKSNFMRPRLFPLASTSGQLEEPMQLGITRKTAIAKERQRRRNAAACFYCGISGHIVRACPAKEPWRESWTADQDAEQPHSSHQLPI